VSFGKNDKDRIQWRLERVGGYDRHGNVFSIARPLAGPVSFPVKTFPSADAREQFINEFTFFRYGGRCPSWYSVLHESGCFSDAEKYAYTKSYTPEGGKDYVIQLIGSGELVAHRTGSWVQPKDRNHHLSWPKSGTKKEEFLPVEHRPMTLGPHEEPGYVSTVKTESVVPDTFGDIYGRAPAAKLEIDSMADEIAEMFGGQVAKAPIKSQDRAVQKIMNDYGGDATRIKDLARNTIIVSPDKMDSVVTELAKRGANVKVINGATDPLGYSGVNSTIETQAGIFGEVQVNTPAMIYAKESESMARALLGDNLYDSIAAKSGIPGGQGHKLYEQWRVLPNADPVRSAIEAQSKAYYDAVRRSIYGN